MRTCSTFLLTVRSQSGGPQVVDESAINPDSKQEKPSSLTATEAS